VFRSGDLFIGSLIPGLLLSGALAFYVWALAQLKPDARTGPAALGTQVSRWALALRVLRVMVPPLLLILAVLGSIFAGMATATEAGAVGALGATMLAAGQPAPEFQHLPRMSPMQPCALRRW
jgi:TRAP-type mannitol/chloroaromatic compound transport system permease large subunit